jgi:hypothetical protein
MKIVQRFNNRKRDQRQRGSAAEQCGSGGILPAGTGTVDKKGERSRVQWTGAEWRPNHRERWKGVGMAM